MAQEAWQATAADECPGVVEHAQSRSVLTDEQSSAIVAEQVHRPNEVRPDVQEGAGSVEDLQTVIVPIGYDDSVPADP